MVATATGTLPTDLVTWCGPERRCVQTARALGLAPMTDPGLRDQDHGRWRGHELVQVEAAEPEAVHTWLTDPAAAPHGGESLLDLAERVAGWLDTRPAGRGVAVTHPAVIRAAMVRALGAPPESFWRIDVVPLAQVHLTARHGRWKLRCLPPAGTGTGWLF